MECPQHTKNMGKDGCIILDKCIYGLVQAAEQYCKKAKVLKNMGFSRGSVDPCFYMKKSEEGVVYVALKIYENLMEGNPEVIDEAIEALQKNELVLKVMKGLKDYLSHKVVFSLDKRGLG